MTDHSSHDTTVQRERATLDELFDVLSKPPRRRILTALADTNPSEDAEFVPRDFAPNGRREDVLPRLHHSHLPKLDEADFIEWNPHSKTITHGPSFDEIEPLVELMIDHEDELPADWP
ncbi:DUF7344 domain-containing protein [Natrarchaeobius chitinivorans]|uniref:ArsR family transcriptional regulator n=1 Tax=Natrarchaeobius chitinivorans TaxID=1679083 RepID=A0A3N6MM47_NATCH|nr:ArsR family transcriptional regulator [Natrarchaeobius chitinivorans]RQG95496.1 ArsR family transcriptional regulator [Natrarchaeobius chitinivorans]